MLYFIIRIEVDMGTENFIKDYLNENGEFQDNQLIYIKRLENNGDIVKYRLKGVNEVVLMNFYQWLLLNNPDFQNLYRFYIQNGDSNSIINYLLDYIATQYPNLIVTLAGGGAQARSGGPSESLKGNGKGYAKVLTKSSGLISFFEVIFILLLCGLIVILFVFLFFLDICINTPAPAKAEKNAATGIFCKAIKYAVIVVPMLAPMIIAVA